MNGRGSLFQSAIQDRTSAGQLTVGYLTRLIAEQRGLILDDGHGVEAFRHLLQTFAAAGDQQALAMAYTFADIFR